MKKTGKEALLAWCKQKTQGYQGVDVQNFSASWRDGLAMCALVHAIRPSLIAWDSLGKDEIGNLNLAFAAAEKLGVPRLLDAEDMFPGPPEPFSMITYLSTLFHAASKIEPSSQASTTPARLAEPERPKTTAAVQPASNLSQRSPAPSVSTTAKSTPTGPAATPPTQINGASCHKCGKAASGMMVDWGDNLFHQECFKCSGCNRPFRKTCLNIDGLPYCDGCGRKAFVQSRLMRHGLATSDTPSQSPSATSNNDSASSNSNTPTSTASNASRTSSLSPTAAAAKTGSTTSARTSVGASSITSAEKSYTTSASVSSGSSSLSPATNGSSANRSPSVSVTSAPTTSSSTPAKATTTASPTVSISTTTTSPIANRSPAGSVSTKSAAASASSTASSPAKPASSTTSSISSQSAPSLSVPSSANRSPAGSTSISTTSTSTTAKTTTATPSISVSPASSSTSKPATTSTVSSASRSPAGSVSTATTKFTSSTATSSPSTTLKTESIVERELREQREKEEELQAARERAKATAASAPNVTSKPATSVTTTETNLKPTPSGRTFGKSISVNSATKEVPVQTPKATVSVKSTALTATPTKTTSPPPGESIIEREMREQREKEAELQAQRNSAKPTAVVAPVTTSPSAPSKDQTKSFDSSSAKADEERARVEAIERNFLSSAKKSSGTLPGSSKVANERPRLVSAMPNLYAPKNQTTFSTLESNSVATSSTSTAATTTTTASIQKTPDNTGEPLAGRRTVSPAAETPTATISPDKQALGRIRATTAASSASQPIAISAPMDSMPPRASIFIQEDPTSSTPTEVSSPPVSVTTSSESSTTHSSSQAPLSPVSAPGRPSSPPPVDWNSTSTKNPDLTSVLPSVPQNSATTPSEGAFDIDSALLAARSASAPVVATSVSNAAVASSSNGQASSAVATEYADDVIEPALGEEDEEMTRAMRRATTNLRRVNVAKVEQGHQGWLKRRDRTATIKLFWTSLWFSLKDSRLLYYKEAPGKNSLATEHLPDGFLSLQFIDSIRISSSSEKKFIVEGQGVKWDLKCSTKEEAADWVEALNDAVTMHNLTERTRRTSLPVFGQDHAEDMVMEGTLNRHTTFGWQSNYWLLQDGMLFYFASQGGKRLGRIPLYHCEFAPYEMSSSKDAIRAFCITTYQNESIILAAKDEMEMHRWLNCMLRQRIVIEEAIDMISF